MAAIGASAMALSSSNVEVVNPFKHSRIFVHDIYIAEKVLLHGISKVHDNRVLKPSPRVVFHIKEKAEGGLSQVESYIAGQLILSTGASDYILHTGARVDIHNTNYDTLKK
ncbi:hypothetical protein [Vibrio hangzhouensis]|uniref:hypothetical protein n=1 Tax=Vibrio hangzhouensis TaxID=462991 RepID=UPI001C95B68C|nr:hypothetical protein [Vibrio hangzhouensis]MBY6196860.1 hypothetical protein [Vibrio hangzhouensis]